MPPLWPDGVRGAVSITFDNLGEAAEIELGLRTAEAPLGGHYSVATALPVALALLAEARLPATFFVEGINAEIYPDALRAIGDAGHELGYHAWCHEEWSALSADAEVANLDRGLTALRAIGIETIGLRPPGGRLNPGTLALLASRGLRYCSPAGSAAGVERVAGRSSRHCSSALSAPGAGRVAVLPFEWTAVDVLHVLPAFAALRARLTASAQAGGPEAIHSALIASIERALADGTHATLVLHTWMIELEREAVQDVLARICCDVDRGELWAAPCCDVAAWMLAHPANFGAPPALDRTSWTTPA